MNSTRRRIIFNASKLFDLGVVAVCLAFASVLSKNGKTVAILERILALQMSVRELAPLLGFLVVAHMIFAGLNLYESKRLSSRRSECIDVLQATTLITFVLAILPFLLRIRSFNLVFLSVFWTGATMCTISSRLIVRSVLSTLRRWGQNSRQMLIVGTNTRALEFAKKIESNPQLGYRIVGFSDYEWTGRKQFEESGHKVLCDLASLSEYLRINVVDGRHVAEERRDQAVGVHAVHNACVTKSPHLCAK